MKTEAKRSLQSLAIWFVLMTATYLIYGFPDFWWFLGFAWSYLIVGGLILVIVERLLENSHSASYEQSPTEEQKERNDINNRRDKLGSYFHDEEFDLESVLLCAKKVKGRKLTQKEIAEFEKLCTEIAELENKIEKMQTEEDDAEAKHLKDLAENVVQQEVQKARLEPQSDERTAAIIAERAEIKRKLRELGFKVNE